MGWLLAVGLVTAALLAGCSGSAQVAPEQVSTSTLTASSHRDASPDVTAQLPRWSELPIRYCIAGFPSTGRVTEAFENLIQRAFTDWGVASVYDGVCAGQPTEGNGVNEVGWAALGSPRSSAAGLYEAGETRKELMGTTIVEADILLDPTAYLQPDTARDRTLCVFSTVLHEVGHLLGLEHSPPPSVMQTGTTECPAVLSAADRATVAERYR
jgi:hypothetical protein